MILYNIIKSLLLHSICMKSRQKKPAMKPVPANAVFGQEWDKEDFLQTVKQWQPFVRKPLTLLAFGGTALCLLGKKRATKDIDLCVKDEAQYKVFTNAIIAAGFKKVSDFAWQKRKGPKLDIARGSNFWGLALPKDTFGNAEQFGQFGRIELKAMRPVDIAITKLHRANKRDYEDIGTIANDINHMELIPRYFQVMQGSLYTAKEYGKFLLDLYVEWCPKWGIDGNAYIQEVKKWLEKQEQMQ